MTLYVFAGPNGSGKSTIIKDFILFYGLDDIEYVCPDVYASTLFNDIDDIKQRYIKAMNFATKKREKLLNENKSMLIETVLSGLDKIEFINKAKQLGYHIISVFVGTSSPSINILRVKKRVLEGGHDVPEESIINRYNKSFSNIPLLAECSDELYIYDNSNSKPKLALSIIDDEIRIEPNIPDWVRRTLDL